MQQLRGGKPCRARIRRRPAQSLPLMLTLPRNCAFVTCTGAYAFDQCSMRSW